MNKRTFILSGPYGGLNIGDDAIAMVLISELEELGCKIVIACDNTEKAKYLFPNNHIIQRLHLRGLKLETIKYLKKVDGIIIGGGEQFEEPRIPNPIWGHIATNIQLLFLTQVYNKFYGTLAVGFNTNISFFSKFLIKYSLKYANFLGIRDIKSKLFLENQFNFEDVILGADPAFLLEEKDKKQSKKILEDKFNISKNSKIIAIIPSKDKFHSLEYLKVLNNIVMAMTEDNGTYVIYAISDIQEGYDYDIYENHMLVKTKNTKWLDPKISNLDNFLELISGVDCVISSRMHPLIFASIQKTPFICISRSSKMNSLMSMLGVNDYFNIKDINSDLLLKELLETLNDYQKYIDLIHPNILILKQRAKEQFRQLGQKVEL